MSDLSQESKELPSVPPVPDGALLKTLHYLYYRVLDRIEWGSVILLLAVVIFFSFAEVVNRNFGWHPWDPVAGQKAVYALTFYLGLYGAVLATRHGKHIAIDVVGPHLSSPVKIKLEIVLYLVAAFACASLCHAASTFVLESIEPDMSYIAHLDGAFGARERGDGLQYPRLP